MTFTFLSRWFVLFIDSTSRDTVAVDPNRVLFALSANSWPNFSVTINAFTVAIKAFFTERRTKVFWVAVPELVFIVPIIANTSLSIEITVRWTVTVESWHASAVLIFDKVLNTNTDVETENLVFSASRSNWNRVEGNDQIDADTLTSGDVESESDSA